MLSIGVLRFERCKHVDGRGFSGVLLAFIPRQSPHCLPDSQVVDAAPGNASDPGPFFGFAGGSRRGRSSFGRREERNHHRRLLPVRSLRLRFSWCASLERQRIIKREVGPSKLALGLARLPIVFSGGRVALLARLTLGLVPADGRGADFLSRPA